MSQGSLAVQLLAAPRPQFYSFEIMSRISTLRAEWFLASGPKEIRILTSFSFLSLTSWWGFPLSESSSKSGFITCTHQEGEKEGVIKGRLKGREGGMAGGGKMRESRKRRTEKRWGRMGSGLERK